jgi:hypothetical protein
LNFYKYAFNNPVDFADPLGLSPACVWVGSKELDSATTATRRYIGPWYLATSVDGRGGSDEGKGGKGGVIAPDILDCVWRRNYVREEWETILYLNTFLCVDHLACGLNLVWFEFSIDKKTYKLGEKPGGTETFVRSVWAHDGLDCDTPGMGPPF